MIARVLQNGYRRWMSLGLSQCTYKSCVYSMFVLRVCMVVLYNIYHSLLLKTFNSMYYFDNEIAHTYSFTYIYTLTQSHTPIYTQTHGHTHTQSHTNVNISKHHTYTIHTQTLKHSPVKQNIIDMIINLSWPVLTMQNLFCTCY